MQPVAQMPETVALPLNCELRCCGNLASVERDLNDGIGCVVGSEKPKRRFCDMDKSGRLIAGFAWAVVLAFLSWLSVFTNQPTLLQPMNVLVFLPIFLGGALLGPLGLVAVLFVPAVFIAWCWTMIRGRTAKVPWRSLVLFVAVAVLSLCDLASGERFAIEYQSLDYLKGAWLISALWWIGLAALAYFAKRRPSVFLNLAFHFALFAWLAWYALPYFGETP